VSSDRVDRQFSEGLRAVAVAAGYCVVGLPLVTAGWLVFTARPGPLRADARPGTVDRRCMSSQPASQHLRQHIGVDTDQRRHTVIAAGTRSVNPSRTHTDRS
jgi:hypothetical protein